MSLSDVNAERAVLAAVLYFAESCLHDVAHLDRDSFHHPVHRSVWEAVQKLAETQQPIDPTTVTGLVPSARDLIIDLALEVVVAETAGYHAARVHSKARRRRWATALTEMLASARGGDEDEEFFTTTEGGLVRLSTDGPTREDMFSAKVVARRTLDELEARRDPTRPPRGVLFGFPEIDQITNGWQPSDLVIIAARPSMGKTALAVKGAASAAFSGAHGLVFSVEMAKESLMERLISDRGQLDGMALRTGRTPPDAWLRAGRAASELSALPLTFNDVGGITLGALASKARRWRVRDAKGKRAFIVVDYLQLVMTDAKTEYDRVTEVTMGLKALAKELEVPVIALSQLNRSVESRTDKRPMKSDLRSSGQIEQDADIIAFLYRDEVYDENTKEPGIAEFIVDKNRQGPCFTAKLGWRAHTTSFYSLRAA